jgi:hypothetical protein
LKKRTKKTFVVKALRGNAAHAKPQKFLLLFSKRSSSLLPAAQGAALISTV